MPSKARKLFDENAQDIERLLKLHEEKGGTSQGRRRGLEVLNKSAIVLITSFWEAYGEDVAAEGLEHIVKHGVSPDSLPKEIKRIIARELKTNSNELSVWSLCGDGWKNILKARLDRLREQRNRKLNTPKAQNIDDLFLQSMGLSSVSSSWRWAKKMTAGRAREKLDKYATLRGEIAHRGKAAKSVTKAQVEDYFDFIKTLVTKTGGAVNSHVKKVTGKPLWPSLRRRRALIR
jgi:hypothetical protein